MPSQFILKPLWLEQILLRMIFIPSFDGITVDAIRISALHTEGSSGPSGVDGMSWRQFCTASAKGLMIFALLLPLSQNEFPLRMWIPLVWWPTLHVTSFLWISVLAFVQIGIGDVVWRIVGNSFENHQAGFTRGNDLVSRWLSGWLNWWVLLHHSMDTSQTAPRLVYLLNNKTAEDVFKDTGVKFLTDGNGYFVGQLGTSPFFNSLPKERSNNGLKSWCTQYFCHDSAACSL